MRLLSGWRRLAPVAAVVVAAGAVVAVALPAQAGITSPHVKESTFYVKAYSSGSGRVTCTNPGEVVVSGGALIASADSRVKLTMSWATSDTTWTFKVRNPTNKVQKIHGRVMCATNVVDYVRVESPAPVQLPPHSKYTRLTLACPNNYWSMAGGFIIEGNEAGIDKLTASWSFANGPGWASGFHNGSGSSYSARIQATCTSLSRPYDSRIVVPVNAGSTNWDVRDCGDEAIATGGGWATHGDFPFGLVTGFAPAPARNDYWNIELSNPDSDKHYVSFYLVCFPQ